MDCARISTGSTPKPCPYDTQGWLHKGQWVMVNTRFTVHADAGLWAHGYGFITVYGLHSKIVRLKNN